jgi:tetratricopeptide (TPR) repeat protein
MDPGNIYAMSFLATALSFKTRFISDPDTRKKTSVEALDLANKVIAADPTLPDPYRVLALHALRSDDLDGAHRAAETFMRLKPRQPDPYNIMGNVYQARGEAAKAVEMYAQAVSLSPKNDSNAVFRSNLANAYFMLGDYKSAIEWHSRALQAEPQNMRGHLGLAMAYALAGDDTKARAEAQEVRRLRPGYAVDVDDLRSRFKSAPPQFRSFLEEKEIPAYRIAGLAK